MTDPQPPSTPTTPPPPPRLARALRAGALAAGLALLASLLAACAGPAAFPPTLSQGVVAHPTGFDPALVARYHRLDERTNDDGTIDLQAEYRGIRYLPRSSDYAGYEGWDVLEVPRDSSDRRDWLRLQLNRDAELAVLWEDTAGWLNGWRAAGTIGDATVYRRAFAAGEAALGAPGEGNDAYTVLIAEAGGAPSDPPPLPAGWDGAAPTPNETCPAALHDLWTTERVFDPTTGEIRTYGTWHPQIDPVYWCYYRHEHGSDPALVGYDPAFRYVADKNNVQREQTEGFKGFAIPDVEADNGQRYHWYVNLHATTSNIGRICARTHTVVVAVVDARTNELVAELSYKGEYGSVKPNEDNSRVVQPTFTTCPDQRAIDDELDAEGLNIFKEVRIIESDGSGNRGYEQWRGGLNRTLGMDFRGGTGMTVDIRDPMTGCAGIDCGGAISTGSSGTKRTIRFRDLVIDGDADTVRIFDEADGARDGVFYTDQYGRSAADPGDTTAVRQYIRPGLEATISGGFRSEDAWRGLYTDDGGVEGFELEGSIGSIN